VQLSDFATDFDDPVDVTEKSFRELSHEIRSKTQGLLGYLDIFSSDVEDELDEEQKYLLSRINFFAKSLADLITELLTDLQKENLSND